MSVDAAAALLALIDERVRVAVDEALRPLRAALTARPDADGLLTLAEVAKLLGCSRAALTERFRRGRVAGEPHPLEQLALDIDGGKRWRRGDVVSYLATRKAAAR